MNRSKHRSGPPCLRRDKHNRWARARKKRPQDVQINDIVAFSGVTDEVLPPCLRIPLGLSRFQPCPATLEFVSRQSPPFEIPEKEREKRVNIGRRSWHPDAMRYALARQESR